MAVEGDETKGVKSLYLKCEDFWLKQNHFYDMNTEHLLGRSELLWGRRKGAARKELGRIQAQAICGHKQTRWRQSGETPHVVHCASDKPGSAALE